MTDWENVLHPNGVAVGVTATACDEEEDWNEDDDDIVGIESVSTDVAQSLREFEEQIPTWALVLPGSYICSTARPFIRPQF